MQGRDGIYWDAWRDKGTPVAYRAVNIGGDRRTDLDRSQLAIICEYPEYLYVYPQARVLGERDQVNRARRRRQKGFLSGPSQMRRLKRESHYSLGALDRGKFTR
jgi:hypothetical protein